MRCNQNPGNGGGEYQTLLNSLNSQTIRPEKILVYIPYGYELPKETVGWEEYIRCEKGMVTQRSLAFEEVNTDYILFCDDDISLEPDSVARLFQGLKENNGDCISPNTFPNEKASIIGKLKAAIAGYAFPRKDDGWAFRVMRNGSYTYNRKPSKEVLPTESAAGPCMLIKNEVYHAIHFDDERWLEKFGYPLGEDLLFYNKLHIMGFKVLVHYKSGIVHLDAGTSSKKLPVDWPERYAALWYIIQYRIKYSLAITRKEKALCIISNVIRNIEQICFTLVKELLKNRRLAFFSYLRGIKKGMAYVRSNEYKSIPAFDAYVKK